MIYLAGEPDDMWWNGEVQEVYLGADLVWKSGPTIEVHDVSLESAYGLNTFHPLLNLTPPPGEVWGIEIVGTMTRAHTSDPPYFQIGHDNSQTFSEGPVSVSGEITSTARRVGMMTTSNIGARYASFVGTVTVTIP